MKKETKAQTASAAVKKLLSIMLALVMLFSITAGIDFSAFATSKSSSNAINWVKSKVGTAIDYDGYYGSQCVDLILAYYNYLGVATVGGNGCDYATNKLPSGWTRTKGGTPKTGDILVYAGGTEYGHVAIYESNSSLYHQNAGGKVKQEAKKYTSIVAYDGGKYWGCIHPNFSGTTPMVTTPSVTVDAISKLTHTSVRLNFTAKNPSKVTIKRIGVQIRKKGISSWTNSKEENMNSSYTNAASVPMWWDTGAGLEFSTTISPNTVYEYRAYVVYNGTKYYSNTGTFNTGYKLTVNYNVNGGKIGSDTYKSVSNIIYKTSTNAKFGQTWTYNSPQKDGLYNAKTFGLSREGYKFIGWGTTASGGKIFDQDDTSVLPTNINSNVKTKDCSTTLYAIWEPIHTHNYNHIVIRTNPTCTDGGYTTYNCSCGDSYVSNYTNAKGHTVVTDKAVSATCTKDGKTAGSHCSVCNTVITAQKTVSATGHSYDSGKVTKAPTVTATGVKTYTCTKCKATKTETIPKLKLSAPTLKVSVNSNGTFKMTWKKVTGAEKYEIYYKQTDGSYKLLKTVTGTSYTTVFAQYGKQYSYKMKAVTSNTKSDFSKVVNATNNKKLQTPTLKVAINSNGTFKMTWNKVTGATSYQIYWKQTDGSYKLLKTVTGTSYTSGFAQYGKQYSYKMRAVTSKNSSATSNFSNVVNAKNTKKLGTPTMKATVNKNGSFKLSWGQVTGATSYQIYWKQANGSYKLLKTVTGTSYTTVVAQKSKTYNYKVRAVTKNNSSATSKYSSVVSAKRK